MFRTFVGTRCVNKRCADEIMQWADELQDLLIKMAERDMEHERIVQFVLLREAIEEAWNLGVSHIGLDIPRSEIDEKYNKLLKKYNLLEEEE